MSNFIDSEMNTKYINKEINDGELIQYMYAKGNKLTKENERLKQELEEMKDKEYKSNYVWKLRVGGDVRGVRKDR